MGNLATENLFTPPEIKPTSPKKLPPRAQLPSFLTPRDYKAYNYEPFAPTCSYDVKKYAKIALNPIVKTGLHIQVGGTFWSDYDIISRNNYEQYPNFQGLDFEIINLIQTQISNFRQPSFDDILKAKLYNSIVYGFGIAEKVFDYVNGYNHIVEIKTKPSWDFEFYTDQADNLIKLVHTPTGLEITEDILDKFIITCFPFLNNANYYGESKLQSVFNDVKILELLEEIRATQTQLLAVRPIVHYFDGNRTDEELAFIQNSMFQLNSASVLSLPMMPDPEHPEKPYKLDLLELLGDRASPETLKDIKDIIEQLQKRVTRVIGIPDDLGVTTAPVGNYARSRNAINILFLNINDNQRFVSDIVNKQIIPSMVLWNYPKLPLGYRLPEFRFQTIEEDSLFKASQALAELKGTGVITGNEPWIPDFLLSIGYPVNSGDVPEADSAPTNELSSKEKGLFKRLWENLKKWRV